MPELMLSDAIDQDVSDEQSNEAKPSARELMMEKIAADNMGRVKNDFDGMDEDIDPEDPDAEQVKLQAPKPDDKPTTQVHKLKVDGEEREVTDDELIRSYQKNAAADRRLEEATNLLREVTAREAQLAAQVQAPTKIQPPDTNPDVRAQVKTALSKLYEGDEDSATEALAELFMKNNRGGDQPTPVAPNIDIDQLKVQIQQSMDIDKAFATIQSDYPDLINDPDLEMLTAMKINRSVASGTPRAQAMIDAANEVYKSVGKVPTGRQDDAQKPSPSNRLGNKQRLDLVKPASGVASSKATPTEENASDVIAEIAARRLGQSMPRRGT